MTATESYQYIAYKIVGVTFKNGRKSRQTILRHIKYLDSPFDTNKAEVSVIPFLYENHPAFEIRVNNEPVGNISAEDISSLNEIYSQIVDVFTLQVKGNGKEQPFGAEIVFRINPNLQAIPKPFSEYYPIQSSVQLHSPTFAALNQLDLPNASYKLTNNKSAEFQEMIDLAYQGLRLHPIFSAETGRYETDFGFFPKSADSKIDQAESYAFVSKIYEINEYKKDVEATVFYNVPKDLFPLDFTLSEEKKPASKPFVSGMQLPARYNPAIPAIEHTVPRTSSQHPPLKAPGTNRKNIASESSKWKIVLGWVLCFPLMVSLISIKKNKWYWYVLAGLSWIIYILLMIVGSSGK